MDTEWLSTTKTTERDVVTAVLKVINLKHARASARISQAESKQTSTSSSH